MNRVQPVDRIDPVYGIALRWAVSDGVEVIALRAAVSAISVRL